MAYTWSFVNGNNTITNEHIVSGTLTDGLYQECSLGNTIARQLNLRLWNVTLDTSSPIELKVSENGGTAQSKGTYYIDTVSKSPYSEYSEVTAFDAMLKANAVYMKEGTWSETTDIALVDEICATMGVTWLNSNRTYLNRTPITIDQAPNIGPNGTTCRQILSVIGCLRGGNWVIDESNNLMLIPLFGRIVNSSTLQYFTTASLTIGDSVMSFDKSDAEPIVGVEFQANGGGSFRAPSNLSDSEWEALDGKILYSNLPFMASQEAVDRVWNTYSELGIPYVPYKAESVFMSPLAALGICIQIKDTNVFLSNRTIDISPLAPIGLTAETTKKSESHYPYEGPQVREARQNSEKAYAAITTEADKITLNVRNIITESEAAQNTINKELEEAISNFDSRMSAIDDPETGKIRGIDTRLDETEGGISLLTTWVYGEDGESGANEYLTTQQSYLTWDGIAATLKVGKTGEAVHTEMRKDAFAVTQNDSDVMLANTDGVTAQAFIATESVTVGNYRWVDEGSLGYSLI